jgi:DNA-directed RNA polymerase beta' subunit
MAVHLPLYEVSQLEARTLMRPCYNVLSPSNGEVILKPTQDMVIGCYYLTMMIKKHPGLIKKWFSNETEALMAFHEKKVQIHTPILVRYSSGSFQIKSKNGELVFRDLFQFEEINEKILVIQKTFCFPLKNTKKYFLFTNLGILTLEKNHRDSFKILSFFLETTPGRLIFSTNFKNSITV